MQTVTLTPDQPAREGSASPAARAAVLLYGALSYAMFLGVFLYALGFVIGFGVPVSLDSQASGHWATALAINLAVLAAFAVQHSVMARPTFKRWWTRIVPPAAERSTYVLFSNLAMIALFAFWQPMGGVIWDVQAEGTRWVLYGLGAAGWLLVLASTFLLNHFDLFGLRQSWLFFRGKPYKALRFGTPAVYRYVRHPLYTGWLMAFWFAPTMTVAHLVFAVMTTAYILVAIQLEERNLIEEHGESYREYRRRVPMLIPFTKRRRVAVEG